MLGWKKLLVVIIVGFLFGYFQTDSELTKAKEATLLVKINFDAGNYVYDAIDLINLKIKSKENDFFVEDMKLNTDEVIDKVSISPVIDIKDIMNKNIEANEIRALFENLEYEDGFLVTEGFKSDYDYHFIKVSVSENSSIKTINKIVQYFNNNPLFLELKERNFQRISSIIYDNEQTINQIDKLIEYYTSENKVNNSQTYIDNKDINPNEIIKTKISLQNRNEQLKDQNITNKDTVMLINEANVMIEDDSIFSNNMLFYPLLFLLVYLVIYIAYDLYSYLEKLDRAS